MRGNDIPTRTVRRPIDSPKRVQGDICVVGSGAAGLSAALEAARAGKRVILVEAAQSLGGQAVNSIIGTFCGLYSNGPNVTRQTYGVADDILRDLHASGAARNRTARNSIIVQYDEIALARWIDKAMQDAGITVLLGAVVRNVRLSGRRITALDIATKFGDVSVEADGFVDASGDATVAWHAGLAVREPETSIFGTQVVLFENFDEEAANAVDRWEMQDRLSKRADHYGLIRKDGFVFSFPGHGTALANMTHVETPLDAVAYADTVFDGRDQADRLLRFLRDEYPAAYGNARIRIYAAPGVRQTRWITGTYSLTAEDVRSGRVFDDAVARCSWPIELHNNAADAYWEELGDNHVHTIPLGSLLHRDADNLAAAGRCIDGDTVGLSSVRVMGPCIAMGAAAAHAITLAGSGSVHQIDIGALREKISDNLDRNDPYQD
ncbi:MAG: 2-polyprenyl-6-methoxyphenol hydroxylase-like FAD-dependent oxidoreductase [Paracoccaceae bacterium]|jgi:2-polyprenyl-6-methoxyphenol hydroxylase-like FAD-dependent oxidoreductase